jgi:hypothetical protein
MARPKIENEKKKNSLTINEELNDILEKLVKEKGISKSKYIEYLIKNDKEKIIYD